MGPSKFVPKDKGNIVPVQTIKAYALVLVSLHSFLTLTLNGAAYLASRLSVLTREKTTARIK
jgi:hypothetical protein